jgi:hypothetical protein
MRPLQGLAVLGLLAPALARADDTDGSRTAAPEAAPELPASASSTGGTDVGSTRAGHHKQFGLSAQITSGSRFIKTWDPADYCGDRGESSTGNAVYCFSRVPVSLDLTATYGIRPRIELMFEMRFGLERDFGSTSNTGNGPRLRHYSPGVRFFFSEMGLMKFFSTAQISLDATGYKDAGNESRGMDFALRNANGIFLDFHDAYSAYAFFGEQLEFKRWLQADLELGIGIQGRYP